MTQSCLQCGERVVEPVRFCSSRCSGRYGGRRGGLVPKKKKICDLCEKEISLSNFERHYNVCKEKPLNRFNVKEKWLQPNGKYECPYCFKEFTRKGIGSHIWRMHTEEGQKFDPNKGYAEDRVVWNRGLTKDTDSRLEERGIRLSGKYKDGTIIPKNKGVPLSEETKAKISAYAKGRNGRNHPTRKTFYYEHKDGSTVVLESTYEVKVAESLDSHNIHWLRPDSVTWTDSKGEDHRYFPDFYLVKFNVYLDPKNDYLIKKDAEKIQRVQEQNDIKVVVLDSKHLEWEKIKEKVI